MFIFTPDGPIKDPKINSSRELYGSQAEEIESMERELVKNFTRFHVENKPIMWPIIALNLDTPGNFEN